MVNVPEKPTDRAIERETLPVIPGNPYSRINREISESDLESPAVQRILLGEVDKLQSKVDDLQNFKSNYHESDKKCAILEEKVKSMNSGEILYSICLTMGSILIGLSTAIWSTGHGWISIVLGGLLIISGIASKVVKK